MTDWEITLRYLEGSNHMEHVRVARALRSARLDKVFADANAESDKDLILLRQVIGLDKLLRRLDSTNSKSTR